jgi:hypothetical protein
MKVYNDMWGYSRSTHTSAAEVPRHDLHDRDVELDPPWYRTGRVLPCLIPIANFPAPWLVDT